MSTEYPAPIFAFINIFVMLYLLGFKANPPELPNIRHTRFTWFGRNAYVRGEDKRFPLKQIEIKTEKWTLSLNTHSLLSYTLSSFLTFTEIHTHLCVPATDSLVYCSCLLQANSIYRASWRPQSIPLPYESINLPPPYVQLVSLASLPPLSTLGGYSAFMPTNFNNGGCLYPHG